MTQGLVVSELAPGTGVRRAHFPSRNRLVAALSDAVVLVQADRGSGSAHTVRHALKLGRPVFVAPWPFAHDAYAGNADWVRRAPVGLRVLADPADVIDAATRQGRPDPAESALDRALTRSARTIDELARRAGVDVVHAARLLVRLELRGTVERAAGGYRRRSR